MWGSVQKLWKRTDGAVAPTVALSLFGLIAAGGLAFDYARLVAMDTELQQAADQAALAAVTQLDRGDDAITHAQNAIQDGTATNRLARNLTRFANDNAGAAVEINSITFCSDFDDSVASTAAACATTTDPTEARFVWVQTSLRTANYAFTPIVQAISGVSHAEAVAGVESSICSISPLFVCTDDENFPEDDDIGKGLLMKTGAQNAWFPGNYGFLDFGPGNPGVIEALLGHGLNGCQTIDESNTEPGNKNATDAINTRFDVYAGVGATNNPSICADATEGTGCPDQVVGKDLSMRMTYEFSQNKDLAPPTDTGSCSSVATGTQGNPNPKVVFTPFALDPTVNGMPRDTCHYSSCTDGNFGDAAWNRNAYFQANYGWDAATWPTSTGLPTDATRYEVYQWELAHLGSLGPHQVGAANTTTKTTGQTTTYTTTRTCSFPKPRNAPPADQGRRILPVVAANCAGLNGSSSLDEFHAIRVVNVFLTEPSMQRDSTTGYAYATATDDKEIYGEIIGPAETPAGGTGFQVYSRNRPYLVR